MNGKIDLRILKTKKVIYNAFEELLKNQSFEDIKVSDICNKSMINRSTFYSHYNDKYDLLAEYINNLKELLSKELDKNTSISNSKDYYLEMINLLLDHIEEKRETFASFMINNKNSITMDIFYDVIFKDVIKRIKKNNEDKISNVPADIVSKFYLGAVISVCTDWIVSKAYSKSDIIKYFNYLIPDNLYK